MNAGFLNIAWSIWGVLALVIAGIFAVFVPRAEKVNALHGPNRIVVRWFHSLVWLLLAVSFFMRAVPNPTLNGLADLAAALGGITYLVYIVTFIKALSSR